MYAYKVYKRIYRIKIIYVYIFHTENKNSRIQYLSIFMPIIIIIILFILVLWFFFQLHTLSKKKNQRLLNDTDGDTRNSYNGRHLSGRALFPREANRKSLYGGSKWGLTISD